MHTPRWEYTDLHLNELPRRTSALDLLNDLGELGWELVHISPTNVAYLKRLMIIEAKPAHAASQQAKPAQAPAPPPQAAAPAAAPPPPAAPARAAAAAPVLAAAAAIKTAPQEAAARGRGKAAGSVRGRA